MLSQEILKFAQSRPEAMPTCGEFLDGVMATSRIAIMLGARSIVRVVERLHGADVRVGRHGHPVLHPGEAGRVHGADHPRLTRSLAGTEQP